MMHKYSTATKVGPPRGEDFFLEKKKKTVYSSFWLTPLSLLPPSPIAFSYYKSTITEILRLVLPFFLEK